VEWDDEGLDEEPASPLLPPEDRLWRHPSEVAGAPAHSVRGTSHAGGSPRVLTVIMLTSAISVLLTVGAVSVVRPFRTRVPVEPGPSGRAEVGDVAGVTARIRPAIAQVVARNTAGDRTWGSGVIYRSDGLVLTTHHIVSGSEVVRVILDDGRELVARLVGSDPDTDIAVLDLDGEGFPTAPLATSRSKAGQPAITIGAPSGATSDGPLVRVSMISAVGQEAGMVGRRLVDLIRTESTVAPGCSGGAVVDSSGTVVGIAVSNATTAEGTIGCATPIAVARAVADQLLETGKVTRGWRGIDGETSDEGALVRSVKPASPAEHAGIAVGDVVIAVDGRDVDSMADLVLAVRERKPADVLVLRVQRGGATTDVAVALAEKPVTA
jgi:S1-C subfamily serine protease